MSCLLSRFCTKHWIKHSVLICFKDRDGINDGKITKKRKLNDEDEDTESKKVKNDVVAEKSTPAENKKTKRKRKKVTNNQSIT